MRVLALVVLACAVATAAPAAVLPGFRTGNIRCAARPSLLHCDVSQADYAAKLQEGCINPNGEMGVGVDWQGFELTGVTCRNRLGHGLFDSRQSCRLF
jgi:hypothetical protein